VAESKPISKDARFVQLWADANFDPQAKADCARTAGFSPTTVNRQTGKIINSLIQNKKMQKELRRAGVDMKRLAEKIGQLLDAKHPLAKGDKPDNFVQLKAAELGIRLHDAFAPTRLDIDKRETKQIVLSAEVIHRLERFDQQTKLMKTGETFDVEPIRDQQG